MKEDPLKIILLEDDMSYGRLICAKLKDVLPDSSQVVHVSVLQELMARLEKESFDVVLLDLMVPDSWGIETFQAVQAKHGDLPVVVLSGINDEYLAVTAVQQGAQDYLVKGKVDEALLTRSIRYSIERKKVEEKLKRANETLEEKVRERAAELTKANERLREEIAERKRVEEKLHAMLELEKMFAEVSANFMSVPPTELDSAITLVLKAIGEFIGADQACVVLFDAKNAAPTVRGHWVEGKNAPAMPEHPDAEAFAWLRAVCGDSGSPFFCGKTEGLPVKAEAAKQLFAKLGADAFIALPMEGPNARILGFILFCSKQEQEWNRESVNLFRFFAVVCANTLIQMDRK